MTAPSDPIPSLFDLPLPAADRNVAPVGRHHPVTAKAAAERALPRTGSKRRQLLGMLAARPAGLTCDDVEALTGWSHQSASPLFTGLRDDGWIVDSGRTRPVRASGNAAVVWVLTDDAVAALHRRGEHT